MTVQAPIAPTPAPDARWLPERPALRGRILVICTRRLGDVLLSTALLRSIRAAWPDCPLDVLTNAGSAIVLAGNPDIDRVLTIADRPRALEFLRIAARLFRRYALAVCALPNDRQQVLAFLAAPLRVSAVPLTKDPGARWKRWLAAAWATVDLSRRHALVQYLLLADCLRIPRVTEVIPPYAPLPPECTPRGPYVVLHPRALFRYKAWTETGWAALGAALAARGLQVVFSGGPAADEVAYVERVARDAASQAPGAVTSLAGRLRFGETATLIRGARLFVGPDTSITHLAAATGVPTIALYGPSPPRTWGPWPAGYAEAVDSPWVSRAPLQHRGNVWLLQGITDCVPCMQEGCERHLDSRADCLDQLPAARVIAVADAALRDAVG